MKVWRRAGGVSRLRIFEARVGMLILWGLTPPLLAICSSYVFLNTVLSM